MLTLTRRSGESIRIGPSIEIQVLDVSSGRVRLGIKAPRELAVHRTELLEHIEAENRRALNVETKEAPSSTAQESVLNFPQGLLGLSEHKEFSLYEISERNSLRMLVSCKDPDIQFLVVEAKTVWPTYPIEEACTQTHISDTEYAVLAIVTAPADGSTPTVNLVAPLIIGVNSRQGKQVIIEHEGLGLRHELVIQKSP